MIDEMNLLESDVGYESLTNLWHVIVREGLRGHHILFSPQDLLDFEKSQIRFEDQGEAFSKKALELLMLNEYNELVEAIKKLNFQEKYAFYELYISFLNSFNSYRKSCVLN